MQTYSGLPSLIAAEGGRCQSKEPVELTVFETALVLLGYARRRVRWRGSVEGKVPQRDALAVDLRRGKIVRKMRSRSRAGAITLMLEFMPTDFQLSARMVAVEDWQPLVITSMSSGWPAESFRSWPDPARRQPASVRKR